MRSKPRGGVRTPFGLKIAAAVGLLYLHVPMFFILLYAFTTEDKSYQFPPPGLTLHWFGVAWERQDIWSAIWLSVRVAAMSTALALVLGTLAAAALYRARFFGREAITLLIILPIALPGISHRHLAARGDQPRRPSVQLLDHRGRPRHVLRGRGVQ